MPPVLTFLNQDVDVEVNFGSDAKGAERLAITISKFPQRLLKLGITSVLTKDTSTVQLAKRSLGYC